MDDHIWIMLYKDGSYFGHTRDKSTVQSFKDRGFVVREYMPYNPTMKGEDIDNLPAGTRFLFENVEYVRLANNRPHQEGWIVNPKNGFWCHWSAIILAGATIEIIEES